MAQQGVKQCVNKKQSLLRELHAMWWCCSAYFIQRHMRGEQEVIIKLPILVMANANEMRREEKMIPRPFNSYCRCACRFEREKREGEHAHNAWSGL